MVAISIVAAAGATSVEVKVALEHIGL